MTIDIIDLNDPQYSNLSSLQLAMVRAAQVKKNELVAAAEEEKRSLMYLMLSHNTARSMTRVYEEERIDARTNEQIDAVRDDLLYQLAYEALGNEGNEYGPYRYPQNPNLSLTPAQRFLVVRNYYMENISDPEARLNAYAMDSLAKSYLGEFYQTLYELLASYV